MTAIFSLAINSNFVLANNDKPDASDDKYADYVVRLGSEHPLNHTQIIELSSAVSRAVLLSYPNIIDRYTAAATEYTVIDALFHSPTFRHIVSFGLHNQQENLGHIRYTNEYEINNNREDEFSLVSEVSYDDIKSSNAQQVPLVAFYEAREDRATGTPIVNMGVAPSLFSGRYSWWQEALIHEIVHHVTGSSDTHEENKQGPTEILAQMVAAELHWAIPTFKGYSDPARVEAIQERDFHSLLNMFQRHGSELGFLFTRLATIAKGKKASPDFGTLTSFCSEGISSFPKYPDHDDDFNGGGAFFLPSASADSSVECTFDVLNRIEPVDDSIKFEGGNLLIKNDFKNLNLRVAQLSFLNAKKGSGFYRKNWDSWKSWYQASSWKNGLNSGLYGYGHDESEGNLIYSPYGITFNDGSFSIGFSSRKHINDNTKDDNFVKLNNANWSSFYYAGQMFFDKNKRPVALVITEPLNAAFGAGWSYIYKDGKWHYEAQDDWDQRLFKDSTLSLDPHAPQFIN
ncbi:hypothetical protein FA893_14165 [Photobacterium damselae subsp. piscicida]|uniref:Aip56 n=3 Tax=Photobacterium damselae TaxID=38293 RepID=Q2VL32_PHODP|nr:M85 family metallopeptidase [Photobacterium damselae]ABA00995.1 Aip56 [Photobacterium damselae subsp. piscicida]OLQ78216.1 hypothetical protein BEI67_20125 [Photobacterium damselae subsp. piscicida]TFZ50892.1 hypothetical protein E4T25_16935 [Photobacterium damselae subsp. piscicida]TJZ88254.1 hypothetical protein FA893_14165 [Photobacterium damselae subsp. piscicida]UMZ07368.1 AIP56 [Photobacterium damselae subsp. piscicida]